MKRLLAFTLIFLSILLSSQDIPTVSPSDAALSRLKAQVDSQWDRLFAPTLAKGASLIDVASFALNAVSIDYPGERVETALGYLLESVNLSMDKPKTYKNFFWYYGDPFVRDTNAVEFCARYATIIWIMYKDRLSAKAKATLATLLDYSAEGIKRHGVSLAYTNIALMKSWNLIALGEYCNKSESREEGYLLFRQWFDYTKENGLCEYLSPTYYAVDIENLSLIRNFTRNADIKALAIRALDYIWADVALNWYAPSLRLGGAHSRDYDRLYGHGGIDTQVAKTLLKTGSPSPLEYAYSQFAFAKPSKNALELFENPTYPRFVYERWGKEDYQRASNYIGRNFSVGSADCGYYTMDKGPMAINLGSGTDTPVISFLMDGRGDYYGFTKVQEGQGHMKALHLPAFVTSAQNDAELAFIASTRDDADATSVGLESAITLPADSELWIDNKRIEGFNYKNPWATIPAANGETTSMEIISAEGRARIRVVDNDRGAGVGIQRNFVVLPGRIYRLRARLMGDRASIYLNFFDSYGNRIGEEHYASATMGKTGFSWSEITQEAPANAATCKAWIYSSIANAGEFYVDDIEIQELTANSSAVNLGGFDIQFIAERKIELPKGSTLFVKREDIVCAIRPLCAYDVDGNQASFFLCNDGLAFGALRLSAILSKARTGRRGGLGVWSYTEEGIDSAEAFANFRKKTMAVSASASLNKGVISLSIAGILGEMELSADIQNEKRLLRKGMKPVPPNAFLWVNGEEIGARLLGE